VLDAIAGVAASVADRAVLLDARWLVETLLDSQLDEAPELDATEAITTQPMLSRINPGPQWLTNHNHLMTD